MTTRMPDRRQACGSVLLTSLAGAALLTLAPPPIAAWELLRHPGGATEPTAPLLGLVVLAAWALTAQLLIGAVLAAAGHLPGLLGRLCEAVAARLVPVAVRRTVSVALGAGLILGPALPAHAAQSSSGGSRPAMAPATISLDWPAVPAPEAVPAPQAVAPIVVQPGDTLWDLAARALNAAGRAPTAAQIAATWPRWWSANRAVVGDNPDLLRPGTPLTAPPSS